MIWALFGQARKRDDFLVNLQSKAAEVTFTFEYEGNVYRVQRALPRGKTAVLEFQIRELPAGSNAQLSKDGGWKPLTERTLRETQARIEQTLRLDYETFINAAFFLQGKADQFTQQTASKRKDVLGTILGLEMWETYKTRTSDKRKALEDEVRSINGRIAEIDAELAEEEPRKRRLKELGSRAKALDIGPQNPGNSVGKYQEGPLLRWSSSAGWSRRWRPPSKDCSPISADYKTAWLRGRMFAPLIPIWSRRAKEIESAYKAWQKTRTDLEEWDKVASSFREHEKDRVAFAGTDCCREGPPGGRAT